MITQKRLREALRYSPVVGVFEWRITGRRIRPGFLAGGVCRRSGYVKITVDGKTYPAHHLAWLYMTGQWPAHELDHKDGDKSNNAFNNLRPASDFQQSQNRRIPKSNCSGVKGISVRPGKNPYYARFEHEGKVINVGRFPTLDEAKEAIEAARERVHGEFANHGLHGYEQEELNDDFAY